MFPEKCTKIGPIEIYAFYSYRSRGVVELANLCFFFAVISNLIPFFILYNLKSKIWPASVIAVLAFLLVYCYISVIYV